MISTEEARQRVQMVKEHAEKGDHEAAHSEEDELRKEVLEYVFANAPGWSTMHILAKHALSTEDIKFERHAA